MKDKERLEKIKVKYNAGNAGKLGEFIDLKLVNPYDLKYLIERVQELEEENINLKAIKAGNEELIKLVDERTETLENKYLALRNIHNITLKTGELVAEENKRYKQYLELIRSTGTHGKDVQTNEVLRSDEAELANEALEGEE
ncbi:hypothetical protein [Virgibacillus pantothenticus]|uniref:Uncharacterized protein n=1 Tax=Virgibacillus pantothenticus TaxID=1473 RepID=A0A0L0QLE1_VIRPA|nr:hypothetical protein [Virgibacillus pantothenticus]KNE19063.1 hypothetical protein AFK71_10915 [Virgibacillus pantothenticus]QTY15509.1 hypothetical protein KBP50_16695 [Virgibacillus pantothenticus]